jgi:CTP:phosphocholine cytidylyltransferase-like protein
MKAVILAGGWGTRLSEETTLRPKPMVEIDPVAYHEDLCCSRDKGIYYRSRL